jgi:serine/threonine-protein phosphatase 2B catalytic subunit
VQQEGFKFQWPKATGLPQTVTLFSAPNYCDSYRNAGAVIKFKNNCYKIKQFSYSPHPVLLPNFMNLFDLSLPFIAERTTLILMNLIAPKQKTDSLLLTRIVLS